MRPRSAAAAIAGTVTFTYAFEPDGTIRVTFVSRKKLLDIMDAGAVAHRLLDLEGATPTMAYGWLSANVTQTVLSWRDGVEYEVRARPMAPLATTTQAPDNPPVDEGVSG
jgi:hypothetical protein